MKEGFGLVRHGESQSFMSTIIDIDFMDVHNTIKSKYERNSMKQIHRIIESITQMLDGRTSGKKQRLLRQTCDFQIYTNLGVREEEESHEEK